MPDHGMLARLLIYDSARSQLAAALAWHILFKEGKRTCGHAEQDPLPSATCPSRHPVHITSAALCTPPRPTGRCAAQILPSYSKYIDFLVLHSYPIWGQNYADYANSNPNFQARLTLRTYRMVRAQEQARTAGYLLSGPLNQLRCL